MVVSTNDNVINVSPSPWQQVDAAYHCFCSKERLQFLRDYRTGYDGHCRRLSRKQVDDNLSAGLDYVIRLKVWPWLM